MHYLSSGLGCKLFEISTKAGLYSISLKLYQACKTRAFRHLALVPALQVLESLGVRKATPRLTLEAKTGLSRQRREEGGMLLLC